MTGIFLGIDAGGSQTRALAGSGNELLGTGLAGPANWTALGPDRCAAAIAAAAGQAMSKARLRPEAVTRACIGLAGYYPPWHEEEVRTTLAGVLPGLPLRLVPDLVAGWAGATGGEPGIVLTVGTGAAAYGRDARGQSARAGGWGPLLGDEGGGYWIGVELLRAVSRALDGRGPATSLTEAVRQHAACARPEAASACLEPGRAAGSVEEALRSVYRDAWSRERIAALCEVASRHAGAGDRVAMELFERAAPELGSLIEAVAHQLDGSARPLPISVVGGVAGVGAVLWSPLRRWVASVLPNARWSKPLGTPLDGALRLAQQETDG
jgi:N-acetylglucosamine kinase-like BadF-type ATPase